MQINNKINIAIDGYSGTGKSSTAREVARKLGFTYLDTGAMYRAVTLAIVRAGLSLLDESGLQTLLSTIKIAFRRKGDSWETFLNGESVEDEIRGLPVAEKVSEVSALPAVRKRLVEMQREVAAGGGIVMDGRDIGTVVLPDAELKIFMRADDEVRALRRQKELAEKGKVEDFAVVLENLRSRDHADSTRAVSPLRQAEDAQVIDTTHLNFEQQVDIIVEKAKRLSGQRET